MAKDYSDPKQFFGDVLLSKNPTAGDHAVRKSWVDANLPSAIHGDSSTLLEYVLDGGVLKLRMKSLALSTVTTNAVQANISAFVTNEYSAGDEFQEGDVIILTNPSIVEMWIHNGGSAGTTADFTQIENALDQATIRTYFSGTSGVDYNSGTGVFSLNVGYMRQQLSADPAGGNLLTYNNATGEMLVPLSSFRYSVVVGTLTANTPATITHNLGQEYCQVACYDSTKNRIDLDIVTVNSNSLTIESNTTLSNVQVVVSI